MMANMYPSGEDSLGWHADDEKDHQEGSSIVSVSLGATRDFLVKPYTDAGKAMFKRYGHGERLTIPLMAGDILVMSGNMQKNYKHTVPKRAKVEPVEVDHYGKTVTRLNLTYRVMQE